MRGLLEIVFLVCLLCGQGLAVESTVLLHYDDGVPEDGMWIDNSRGHAVLFTPPSKNWTLSKIAVSGMLNPQSDLNRFVVEIWDENFDLIYTKTDDPKSYFGDEMAWAEIDVPDIPISSDFYVCFFEFSNVYVGADLSSTSSNRSFIVSRETNRIDTWDLRYLRNETDWSIAALGLSPAPEVNLTVTSSEEAVIVEAMITDPDGNLARASLQVIDNESLDVVWSEQRLIEGGEANPIFTWSRELFQITNGTDVVKPVFAFNTVNVSPNKVPYLVYSAPCILTLTPNGPEINAAAYFDQDGEFHALIDANGFTHYMSRELLKSETPEISYGDYSKNDITMIERISSLSFFNFNFGVGMVTHSPLMLMRSPVHHYKLGLDKVAADLGDYVLEVYAEDSVGNRASKRTLIVNTLNKSISH